MNRRLLVFPHSHFCEKARWALDFKGLPYQEEVVMPGVHLKTIRRVAPGTTVPVLIEEGTEGAADTVIQGSSRIIDYLEQHYPENSLTPSDAGLRQQCLALESQLATQLGEQLRSIRYHTLLAQPDYLEYCFMQGKPTWKRWLFRGMLPVLKKKIYQAYVVSDTNIDEVKQAFGQAMETLAEQLSDRQYLVGDTFTRADLSVTSMLSLLVMPQQHPFAWQQAPRVNADTEAALASYQDHPVADWVRRIYRQHR